MIRFAALVGALTACDAVFGLERTDIPPPPCGPYADTAAQVFDPALQGVADFALGADATHGSVVATVAGKTRVALVALVNGIWQLDTADAAFVGVGQSDGRIVGDTDVYATVNNVRSLVSQYQLAGASYTAINPFVENDSQFDLVVGNEVTTVDPTNGPVFRRVVLTKRPTEDGQKAVLVLVDRKAPFNPQSNWTENLHRTDPINDDPNLVDLGRGAITADSQALVYAAKFTGDPTFDLYVSTFDRGSQVFPRGTKIDSVDRDDTDETDPSISADCKVLSFRRGQEVHVSP